MLTTVEFDNYRGFSNFKMEGLTAVNLFVGKNNSGKTAALEGIQFLKSRGMSWVLFDAAERRGEIILQRLPPQQIAFVQVGQTLQQRKHLDICHFFNGHEFACTCFRIEGDEDDSLCVHVESRIANPKTSTAERQYFEIFLNDKKTDSLPVSAEGGVQEQPRPQRVSSRVINHPREKFTQFIGIDSLQGDDLALAWDDILREISEKEVVNALKILEPNLLSIQFTSGIVSRNFYQSKAGILVQLSGHESRVPLGSMGDGMTRLLRIACALVTMRGGSLFIDEIDTGLHYTALTDLWKLVLTKVGNSETQVFTTTHSWDCIAGLARCLSENPGLAPLVSIHKIDRDLQHSVPFAGDSITTMVQADIDPR